MRHPPQREMWEGLTGMGCLGLVAFIILMSVIVEYIK